MSQFCQIEYVSSDSDIGMPCGKTAVARCALTADLRFVPIVAWNAAAILSAVSAITTT